MIQEINVKLRKQTPTPPNEWLYEEVGDERHFAKEVCLGKNAEPWPECTDEEKVQWEEEHKEPEPTPEPTTQPVES